MNFVDSLDNDFQEVLSRRALDLDAMCYGLAYKVIRRFLGKKFCKKYVLLHNEFDDFMLNKEDSTDAERYLHQHRVAELADIIFQLRYSENFSAYCSRLKNETLRRHMSRVL